MCALQRLAIRAQEIEKRGNNYGKHTPEKRFPNLRNHHNFDHPVNEVTLWMIITNTITTIIVTITTIIDWNNRQILDCFADCFIC